MEKALMYLIELTTKEKDRSLLMRRQIINQETIVESIKGKVLENTITEKAILKVLKNLLEQNGLETEIKEPEVSESDKEIEKIKERLWNIKNINNSLQASRKNLEKMSINLLKERIVLEYELRNRKRVEKNRR